MNKYLNNFKAYFRTDKTHKITFNIQYQRLIEKFNKNFYFRINFLTAISLFSNYYI